MKKASMLVLAILLISLAAMVQMDAAETVQAANTVSVTVTAKEKITLTMADATIDFEQLDPGTTTTSNTAITANVRSNKAWDLTYTASGMDPDAGMPLSQLKWGVLSNGFDATSFAASGTFLSNQPKAPSNAGQDITHYYTIEVPWTADPGAYSATVTYSATFH
ncbi:MAG TPA: hypothetical protein GX507_05485 [Clostridia bacterium]|nr:hypothetical protein [Clostridia bacterium]